MLLYFIWEALGGSIGTPYEPYGWVDHEGGSLQLKSFELSDIL